MGKRLPARETTIAIQFKRAPHPPFAEIAGDELQPNVLVVHVQPNEGVSLEIGAKVPGQGMAIRTVHMDFLYGGAFRTGLPEAYERLILDAMLGDATLFTRSDEIEEQWALVDAIVAAWRRDRPSFPNYPAGPGGRWRPTRSSPTTAGPGGRTDGDVPPDSTLGEWSGEDIRVGRSGRAARRARSPTRRAADLRTSVMTHIAWVPAEWEQRPRRRAPGSGRGIRPG